MKERYEPRIGLYKGGRGFQTHMMKQVKELKGSISFITVL